MQVHALRPAQEYSIDVPGRLSSVTTYSASRARVRRCSTGPSGTDDARIGSGGLLDQRENTSASNRVVSRSHEADDRVSEP
jgi:hypothetical protein